MCPTCGHRHRLDTYCHVFCHESIAFDPYEENEDAVNEGEVSDSINALTQEVQEDLSLANDESNEEVEEQYPLSTPQYAEKLHYKRCNCKIGVPNTSRKFEPISNMPRVGEIKIMMYAEIQAKYLLDAAEFNDVDDMLKKRIEEKDRIQMELSQFIPHIVSFLKMGEYSQMPLVNRHWNNGVFLCRDYIDLRDSVPHIIYRAHVGQVESLLIHGSRLSTFYSIFNVFTRIYRFLVFIRGSKSRCK